MSKKLCLSGLFVLGLYGSIWSQSVISGRVIDQQGAAVSFANILLINTIDSSLVKGELSDDNGGWTLQVSFTGTFMVRVVMLGYTDYDYPPFTIKKAEPLQLPEARLQSSAIQLAAVEVVARKPFLEQRAGKLVVNVDQSITGQGGSLVDVLMKAPGLVVMNGKVKMAGRSGVTILIDGKPTRFMDIEALLREMPADNIERIEIIHQPDASFDADGTGGVINVILKKNVMLGTNGTFLLAGGMGKLAKYRSALAINHGAGPWRLSFNGGYMYRSNYEELHLNRKVGEQQFDQSNYKPSKPGTGYFRSNIDWTPSTRHIFGLSLGYTGTQNNRLHTNTTAIGVVDAAPFLELETNNQLNKRAQQYNAGGNYTFLIDSSGQKLEADVSWIGLNRQGSSLANTAVTSGESILYPSWRNDEPSQTNIAVGKVDYTRPLTKALKMQAGAKYSYANIDNNLRSWNETGGEWVSNPQQTNHFVYTEHTGAAYINASYSNKNWEANAGLRYEDNSAIGRSLTLDSTKSRRLQQLFPSFSVAAPMGKHFGMSASYSYRIERPSYQTLNPFIYYYDPYTFEKGNSDLRPELTHSGKMTLTYDKHPFISLEYSRTKDIITLVTEQDDATGAAYAATVNLDYLERYGGSVFFPMAFAKGLSGYGSLMLFYNRYSSDYLGGNFDRDVLSFSAYLQVAYKIGSGWSAELSGWYQGEGIEGIMNYKPFYSASMGVQKKLLDDRATLRLSYDSFAFRNWRGTLEYQNMDIDVTSIWETRVVNATFTWQFGSRFMGKDRQRANSTAEEATRANRKD